MALLLILGIFTAFQVAEQTVLRSVSPNVLRWVHLARGVGTSILVTILLIIPLSRGMGVPIARSLGLASEPRDLRAETFWMIRLRWIASLAAVMFSLVGLALGLFPQTPLPVLGITVAALPVVNLLFFLWTRNAGIPKRALQFQIAFDLLFLSVFVHYTGGLQNPLLFLASFPVMIAGILLSRREAFACAAIALLIFLTLGIRECTGLLPHYPLTAHVPLLKSPLFVGPVAVALALTLFGTAYFTTQIVSILRRRESEFAQAAKMAAIGELAGALAHEINNPLAIISGKVESLLELNGQLPPRAHHDVAKISKHVNRIAAITRGMLSYSRPSHGLKESTSINPIIEESMELFRARARSNGVNVQFEPGPELPRFRGNANEISQVVVNLANNAIDAMPKGGRLRLSTRAEKGWIVLEVADTGVGIAEEARDRLFEPFFTTKREGGTGLGLSICHGLVRSHEGGIEIESEPGAGSTFRVKLPALKETP